MMIAVVVWSLLSAYMESWQPGVVNVAAIVAPRRQDYETKFTKLVLSKLGC